MESTLEPQLIYDLFARHNLSISRIDHFDKGNYAEIRIDLNRDATLTPGQLLELSTRLKIIENSEHITIEIVNIDMRHKALRLNIHTQFNEDLTHIKE